MLSKPPVQDPFEMHLQSPSTILPDSSNPSKTIHTKPSKTLPERNFLPTPHQRPSKIFPEATIQNPFKSFQISSPSQILQQSNILPTPCQHPFKILPKSIIKNRNLAKSSELKALQNPSEILLNPFQILPNPSISFQNDLKLLQNNSETLSNFFPNNSRTHPIS